jgi:molybdenum cofactor synthesis domain-containing protein
VNALVLTVSDRVCSGEREDASGPAGVQLLEAAGFAVITALVPDDLGAIQLALNTAADNGIDIVITTGGTGLGPRDVTPEATAALIQRPAPGIVELVRRSGSVPTAVLSRGVAGVVGRTLVINLAGSTGAVRDGIDALLPLLPHAVDQLRGGDH